jgi:hypothetical protein
MLRMRETQRGEWRNYGTSAQRESEVSWCPSIALRSLAVSQGAMFRPGTVPGRMSASRLPAFILIRTTVATTKMRRNFWGMNVTFRVSALFAPPGIRRMGGARCFPRTRCDLLCRKTERAGLRDERTVGSCRELSERKTDPPRQAGRLALQGMRLRDLEEEKNLRAKEGQKVVTPRRSDDTYDAYWPAIIAPHRRRESKTDCDTCRRGGRRFQTRGRRWCRRA